MSPLANNNYHSDDEHESDHFIDISHRRRRRKVHFQPWVDFVTIRHVSDYSKEEIESSWYSPEELRSRKRKSTKKTTTTTASSHVSHHYDSSVNDVVSTHEVNNQGCVTEHGVEDDEDVYEADGLTDTCLSPTRTSRSEAVGHDRCQAMKLHDLFQW